ncbi:hypothetical protein TTMV1_gp2 [Torque teno mini virus 1]|uniref:Capsid protein n=1 Tax=Torque teno mini virus 1 (isolate TLMV-CBD279) TaxID=766183 RepID=CAPSD_TTVB1|nr:hypothetical protein TTMV1_gp2 [Torque teno mini virus 1]Q9QU30.1 RecName: Full=Capsid protein [Torque teno mini virus 1 (isolate TLMV-CBD279)]BAA86951.1 unnamed protein product [Torque teno mini virus 1]
MPPFYYRRRWYSNPWRRKRLRFRRRRLRRPIRKRFRRRRWVRRRRFFRFKRKLRKIRIDQWQPETIRKCHVKGNLCLLTCGRGNINHNYILTSESYVPTSEPGGGSWSILQMTTRVLYDEYKAARNWWTKSNSLLPLTKYIRCKLKFYRSDQTDYIVTIQRTGPFEVTLESYLSTQPSRHLMNHKAFIVPKLGRGPNKETYVKKIVRPPALFQSKWYFSQDIYNTPLFILTVSSCSLDQMYAPQDQISTNISLFSLNTNVFQINNWHKQPYTTKAASTLETYLYCYHNGHEPTQELKWKDIILLGNMTNYTDGKKYNTSGTTPLDLFKTENKPYWGNVFTNLNQDQDVIIYYGTKPKQDDNWTSTAPILPITSLYVECRYNPFKDKGTGNKVYLVPTDSGLGSFLTLPTKSELIITDLPLWLITWGWIEWLKKSRPVAHIEEEYQVVIQSKYIHPQLPCYVLIDKYFRHPPEGQHYITELSETDKLHWHPKYSMQTEQLELIAETGPAAPKINNTKQIEAHLNYDFLFKWGGSPAPMETITDPAEQEKFPSPSNQLQGLQIESPGKPKQYYLYTFDEKRSELTMPAAKRLKKDFTTPTFFTDFGTKDIPLKTQEETDQISEDEEIETSLPKEDHLKQQLQRTRQYYREGIRKLLKTKKLFPL